MGHPSLIGRKFGKLTVREQLPSRRFECPSGPAVARYWKCECDCGTFREVSTANLTSGQVRSCGCIYPPCRKKRPFESLFNELLRGARHRKIAVTLTYEEYVGFTVTSMCHYCSHPILWIPFNGAGYQLDRKDNSRGYDKDNCVVCCWTCNVSKADRYTYEEWVAMTKALQEFRREN